MALKACIECKKEISTDANPCPNCGKKNPHGSSFLAVCAALLVVFGIPIVWMLAHTMPHNSPASDPQFPPAQAPAAPVQQQTQPARAASEQRAIGVSSKQLFDEYQANEVRADDRYKGKPLLVGGTVQSIDKDLFDNIVLVIATSNQFMGIHATMKDSEKGATARLSKGAAVTLACKGSGMVMGSPLLSDCVFQ